jgi:hypothetical protein
MGVYQNYADKPNLIKLEGQEITLKFVRNNDGTGTVTWNIPTPNAGCAPGTQGAYDGIVITVDGIPANYISTSPKDGTFYNSDPTADRNISMGDKLDTALIVGAFYNDRTTTSLTITDIKARTAYYVSAYAVDNVGRYHREGVHAYSLPTGALETRNTTDDKEAFQDILLDVLGGYGVNSPTMLDKTKAYTFVMWINKVEYTITINGVDAQTYSDLIDAINEQFMLLGNPIELPFPPNKDGYYWDAANKLLYQWDGFANVSLNPIVSTLDPSVPIVGTYWYNPTTKLLKQYESGWVTRPFLNYQFDPTQMPCDQLWFDGTDAWQWDGNHWNKLCIYIQTTNPALAPVLSCDSFWFDTTGQLLYKWNDQIQMWDEVLAILSPKDPNTLNTGDFWFNETTSLVYEFVGGTWNQLGNIRYAERNSSGGLDNPVANTYWYIPTEGILYKRNSLNTLWIQQDLTSYPTDPRIRNSGDLWWRETSSLAELLAWDILNNVWIEVELFVKSTIDPSLPPNLPTCAVWFNPMDNTMKLISGVTCNTVPFISFPFDPTKPALYSYWYNSTTKTFNLWNGTGWDVITPIVTGTDPFSVSLNELWFDTANNLLKKWNGASWDILSYSLVPLVPTVGTLWWDTANEQLYTWDGTNWVTTMGIAGVEFFKAKNQFGRDYMHFFTMGTGCTFFIRYMATANDLFSQLKPGLIYTDPVEGASGIDAGPMYNQLGVGDDGSPDERRAIQSSIRLALGSPSVTVELTKEQLDECINYALLHVRKYSTLAYKRGYFFLQCLPNQQTYVLTNRCVGFNKIVNVMDIQRMSSSFFRTAYAGNDLFGVAALQQLYTIGAFDMLSFHLVSSYIKELETLFASRIMFQWNEKSRELKMYNNFLALEKVLVDAEVERTEQELMTDRELRLWIIQWSIAEAKMFLSQPRGKYQQLPGPNGSTALNTSDLINQSQQEKEKLLEQLSDMAMQGLGEIGMKAHFISG